MKTLEGILALFQELKQLQAPEKAMAAEIRSVYGGDIALPLPEMDRTEMSAVANLMVNGIDGHAQRIASVTPSLECPPVRPGIKKSEDLASDRRRAILGWWEHNKLDVIAARRARHLVAYGISPVVLRPEAHRNGGIPRWELRDPLTAYPGPTTNPDDVLPSYAVFNFRRSLAWLRQRYPENIGVLYKGDDPKPSDQFECLEYMDDEEYSFIVLGKSKNEWDYGSVGGSEAEFLERMPNRCGVCPAVFAGRPSLHGHPGQFDQTIGMFYTRAKLMALQIIATKRGVFPETWLVANEQNNPQIVQVANANTGQVGIVKGGSLDRLKMDPSFANLQAIDRLERAERIQGMVPADMTGEAATNVRTGRRGAEILSNTIDFPVQEGQMMLAVSREVEDKVGIAIVKSYFGREKHHWYVSWKGAKGYVDYTPNVVFETDDNKVTYPFAGADVNGLTIMGGQLIGIGAMSKRRFMEMHPLIDDAEQEHDVQISEGIEAAMLAALQQQASQGLIPPNDLARIMQLVRTNKAELADAIMQAQEEAQKRQSTTEEPAIPGAPETMPGLAQEGMGAEAGAIPEPTPDMGRLAQLLGNLRRPQMALPSENVTAGAIQ